MKVFKMAVRSKKSQKLSNWRNFIFIFIVIVILVSKGPNRVGHLRSSKGVSAVCAMTQWQNGQSKSVQVTHRFLLFSSVSSALAVCDK